MKNKEGDKCSRCVWGSWTGLRYHCIFSSCVRYPLIYSKDLWLQRNDEWIQLEGTIEGISDEIISKNDDFFLIEDMQLFTYHYLRIGSKVRHKKLLYKTVNKIALVDLDQGLKIYILRKI